MSPSIPLVLLLLLEGTSISGGAILVRDIAVDGVDSNVGPTLTEDVTAALSSATRQRVVGQRELSLTLEQSVADEAIEACAGPDCDRDRLGDLDIRALVTGRVSKLGTDFVLTLKYANIENRTLLAGEACVAATVERLRGCARMASSALVETKTSTGTTFAPLRGAGVAVLRLATNDLSEELGATMTELVVVEAKRIDGLKVISQREVTALLGYEADRQIANCENDAACLLEIAGALDTEFAIGGAVSRIDDTLLLQLDLMNIRESKVVRRVSDSLLGEQRDLASAVRVLSRELLGGRVDGDGSIRVLLDREDARVVVSIDGRSGHDLANIATSTFSVGKHAISIRADGYEPIHREIYVVADQETRLRAKLSRLPTKWHESAWFWAVAGVAIVGAGTAIAIGAASRDAPPGDVRFSIEPPPQ